MERFTGKDEMLINRRAPSIREHSFLKNRHKELPITLDTVYQETAHMTVPVINICLLFSRKLQCLPMSASDV